MTRAHIIGAGLIGTSIGLSLARAGGWVVSFEDVDADRVAVASTMCTSAASVEPQQLTVDSSGLPVDLVIVAVPPGVTAATCARALAEHPRAVVTDVCSVKAGPIGQLRALGASTARFVGGHPMGGREVSGPQGARADLLDDRAWVLTPTPDTAPAALALVQRVVRDCRAAAVVMDADEHDAAVAVTSHVPQVLSSALAELLLDLAPKQVQVSGQGLRDMTRIAGSDPALWSQILTANAGPVAEALREVADRIDGLAAALARPESDDAASAAATLIERGRDGRERIPGKHGGQSADFDVVPVLIADEPGQLAQVFVAAGDAGFNLEDVRIDHVLGRPSGLVEVSVRSGLGPALTEALTARGFDVRA